RLDVASIDETRDRSASEDRDRFVVDRPHLGRVELQARLPGTQREHAELWNGRLSWVLLRPHDGRGLGQRPEEEILAVGGDVDVCERRRVREVERPGERPGPGVEV